MLGELRFFCEGMTTFKVTHLCMTTKDVETLNRSWEGEYEPYLRGELNELGKKIPITNILSSRTFSRDSIVVSSSFCSSGSWGDIKRFFDTTYAGLVVKK